MVADLDASLLRTFLSCVRAGSVSRAAAASGRSQPALSQQLRRLEDIVGEQVLRRTPVGVTLTPAGEALVPYAERILALASEAVASARRGRDLTGRCGVGLLEDLATASLTTALAEFAHRHPSAVIEVATLPGPEMRKAFDSGRVQLVLGDVGYLDQAPVRTTRLPLVWVASAGFDTFRDPLPLALFSEPCRWRAPVQRVLDRTGRRWRVSFESTGLAGVLAGVRAGIGVAALLSANTGPDIVVLGRGDGMPELPEVEIGLARRVGSDGDSLLDALETVLSSLM